MTTLQQFKIHPSVIYSIIREQSGSPQKALAELVMNSVDAGAKNIHLELSAEKFSIKDDGLGFKNMSEIEEFFGKFGTPHKKGDAVFGQFRLGRGQAFSIAKTEWRSGCFGMSVDLACVGKTETHGYHLHEFAEHVQGCEIHGDFYESLHIFDRTQSAWVFDSMFQEQLAKFLKKPSFSVFSGGTFFDSLMVNLCLLKGVNVYLNGHLVSGLLERDSHHILETDTANYYANKSTSAKGGIVLLNKGIYIASLPFSLPMVIDFKQSPNLNISRNQINAECPIYIRGRHELYEAMVTGYTNGEKWAVGVGNLIASNIKFSYTQFEKEFVQGLSNEQRVAFAKSYKIYELGVDSVEEINLWDALEKAKNQYTYLNESSQNSGLRRNQFKSITEEMADFDIGDRKLLVDLNDSLLFTRRIKGYGCEVLLLDWLGVENPNDYLFEKHTFFLYANQLETNSLTRISINKTPSAPKNKSLEIFETIDSTKLRVEVSKAWVSKNDLARQTFEDGLHEYQQGLIELIKEYVGELPENIVLAANKKIIPYIVRKLDFSTIGSGVYEIDGTPYLIVTEESFAQGSWMSDYMGYLFAASVLDTDLTYENSDFNENLHDSLEGSALAQIFEGLQQVALQASALLIKKPMRESRKKPIEAMKSAWAEIAKGMDDVGENEMFFNTLNTFNQLNTN